MHHRIALKNHRIILCHPPTKGPLEWFFFQLEDGLTDGYQTLVGATKNKNISIKRRIFVVQIIIQSVMATTTIMNHKVLLETKNVTC